MTYNKPQRRSQAENPSPKPYKLVSFPKSKPKLARPAGQHKYLSDRIHGVLDLTLTVCTPLHVATGAIVLGSDVGENEDLIKTMVRDREEKLIIPGSSLKGVVRSVYEAITGSCLCKVGKISRQNLPRGYQECEINLPKKKREVCPACQVFGALNWQGLVHFSDARCQSSKITTGFMPSLHSPHSEKKNLYYENDIVKGRKFYYHFANAVDRGKQQGIPVQQAAKEYVFSAKLHLKNLSEAELGTLLIVLGQDPEHPIALKVGGGKPIGMGSMTVKVDRFSGMQNKQNIVDRYSSYHNTSDPLTDKDLEKLLRSAISDAHKHLVQSPQLQEVTQILTYPSDRQPPQGQY